MYNKLIINRDCVRKTGRCYLGTGNDNYFSKKQHYPI